VPFYEDQIWQLAEPVLAAWGLEPILVECLKMKSRWVVRVYIDREEGGVSLEDCTWVSNQLGDVLDVHDLPPGPYTLEVSSPGLDRPLHRDCDFLKYRGSEINLRLTEKISGRKHLTGELVDYEDGESGKVIVLRDGGEVFRIPRAAMAKANLVYK